MKVRKSRHLVQRSEIGLVQGGNLKLACCVGGSPSVSVVHVDGRCIRGVVQVEDVQLCAWAKAYDSHQQSQVFLHRGGIISNSSDRKASSLVDRTCRYSIFFSSACRCASARSRVAIR